VTGSRDLQVGIELRCTLLDATTGVRRDLHVVAPVGATLADLLAASGTGLAPGRFAAVEACPVTGDHPLGRPPLLHGCLIVVGGASVSVPGLRGAGLQLDVVAGPDGGRTLDLGPGDYVLGRCEPADLRLDDTQVSRRHAVLEVHSDSVLARDLGSTNGTWLTQDDVAGSPWTRLDGGAHPLAPGARLRVGRSTVALRVPAGRPASTRLTLTGRVEVNRPPRPQTEARSMVLERPTPPGPLPRPAVPWIGMAVPLVLCLGAAWFLRQPTYLLFGLMSPLVLAATAATDRLTRDRRRRRRQEGWRLEMRAVEQRARLALGQERAALRRTVGDPALVSRVARLPTSRLWERTSGCADLLLVSVGTGDVRSADLSWAGQEAPCDDSQHLPAEPWSAAVPLMPDAPVTVNLVTDRHLGLCGDRTLVLRLARWVVGQLVVWHGPGTVQLLVVSDAGSAEWHWTRWLPHTVSPPSASTSEVATFLDELLRRRRQQRLGATPDSSLVVLLDGAHLAHLPGVAAALAEGPEVGVHVVCLTDDQSSLPSACGAVVDVRGDGAATLQRGGLATGLIVDGTRRAWAQTLSRSLAPLTDATPTPGRLPTTVTLLDLLAVDATSPDALVDSWRRRPRSTRAVVGRRVDGPFEIDLASDGPHLLVGGTTGSGKSELLRTLVTSLAVVNRPDEMTFVLVDYKGGAAFRGCAELIHTAGLVTDLDDQLATRALASLDSELRRRERLLHDAGCRDVAEYQARRDADPRLAPLPRLVLVIDEFRALASELPDFLEGIVRVASLGRSLGVHVVLATQRPGGVVTADIRANVNLRICLRVRDRVDSDDVLESSEAAAISPDTPGRAFVRRGGDALVAVQIARVDDCPRPAPSQTQVLPLGPDDWLATTTERAATDEVGDDLRRVVAACQTAAGLLGVAVPAPVWAAPLPDQLPFDEAEATGGPLPGEAVVGLVDLPHRQLQQRLGWHPRRDGHLAVAGAPRTGRTSTLATIAAGLVRQWSPSDLHLHVIGAGHGALSALTALPHTGTVVTDDEPRRLTRLVARLSDEVAERRRQGPQVAWPALVLLVDGWEALVERLEDVDHGRPVDDLLALIRDGESVGLRAIVTGGRGVLLSRVSAVVGQRLMLRPNDPTDLLLAGIAPSALPSRQPPGRAVRSDDGAQVQIASPPSLEGVCRSAAERWPSWLDVPATRRALRLRALPTTIDAGELTAGPRPGRWALVGCGGDAAEAVGIDLAVDRFAVVAGPPGSGRSTALLSMARSLHAGGVNVLAICPGTSPLTGGPWRVLRLRPAEAAQGELLRGAQVVLVDDVERIRDQPWEPLLCQLAQDPSAAGIVVAGLTTALLGTFRGLGSLGRSHRTGVLLRPESGSDGEVLGVRAELGDHDLTGRGQLVVRGHQTPVQVARWTQDGVDMA
jgi:S-DNA-T family DNA segregation ATPase FtsK/SpoIIIE